MSDVASVMVCAAAREALAQTNDQTAAVELLMARAQEDAGFLAELVGARLRPMCSDLVRKVLRSDNRSLAFAAGAKGGEAQDYFAAAQAGLLNSYRLPSGQLLADARRPDLRRASLSMATAIGDMVVKRKWFDLMADALADDETTASAGLGESRVSEMRQVARAA